jgi:hypothetical protein
VLPPSFLSHLVFTNAYQDYEGAGGYKSTLPVAFPLFLQTDHDTLLTKQAQVRQMQINIFRTR